LAPGPTNDLENIERLVDEIHRKWGQDLNPHDIDNDGLVELPRKAQVPVSTDEYTKAQVVRHTITHEMGHAVGCCSFYPGQDYHCNEPTCVMYKASINWSRDGHFCNECKGTIYIHND